MIALWLALGAVSGWIHDRAGGLEDVTVVAVGATTGAAITDESGHFDIGELPAGHYVLRFHVAGMPLPLFQEVDVQAGQVTQVEQWGWRPPPPRVTGRVPIITRRDRRLGERDPFVHPPPPTAWVPLPARYRENPHADFDRMDAVWTGELIDLEAMPRGLPVRTVGDLVH